MNSQKILIAEDDELYRDILKELLQEEGFKVEEAGDGEEGLQKISNGGYTLVLLEIMLPQRGGLDILRQLRIQPPKQKNGPIILLVNLGQDHIIKEGFSLGAEGYLLKSGYTPDQIIREIHIFLSKDKWLTAWPKEIF